MRSAIRLVMIVMVTGLLLVTNTGCDRNSYAAGFASGWLIATGNVLGTTEMVCYRNGVPVECGSLPDNLAP